MARGPSLRARLAEQVVLEPGDLGADLGALVRGPGEDVALAGEEEELRRDAAPEEVVVELGSLRGGGAVELAGDDEGGGLHPSQAADRRLVPPELGVLPGRLALVEDLGASARRRGAWLLLEIDLPEAARRV